MTFTIAKRIGLKPLLFTIIVLSLLGNICLAQSTAGSSTSCPQNIDFEMGDFTNWKCYTGTVSYSDVTNIVSLFPSNPISGIHEMIGKGSQTDPYGGFPTSAPDGSGHSVKLGNNGTGAQAERLSYEFSVPNTQKDFVITYQYAVVLEDPGHNPWEQPRFTAKVFDITENKYIQCGSFDYIATASLPGFKSNYGVIYKDWTPVSINLNGYQGHKLRLEFTTADCTASGHFGYAYIDLNDSCSELIKGADFCPSEPNVNLVGPAGFDKYIWYNADRSKVLGNTPKLSFPSAGADGKLIQLDIIPFVGFGCNYTITETLHALPDITFELTSPSSVCFPSTIDLTSAALTAGSDANLTYTYWKDAAATVPVATPKAVNATGTYYIKATAPSGCTAMGPVQVTINPLPVLKITDPATVCANTPVDLTAAAITAGTDANVKFAYWTDANATKAITNPAAVVTPGTYYIQAINSFGCYVTMPVKITNYALPVLKTNNPAAVCYPSKVDLTAAAVTTGSDANLQFFYYTDAAATLPLSAPAAVGTSGTYYIKAINGNGCVSITSVEVTINPLPDLVITAPLAVCYPDKVNITTENITNGSSNVAQLTYWMDANATVPLQNPRAVGDSALYYIKATSPASCEIVKPVLVVIHALPVVKVTDPKRVYIPNSIDITKAENVAGSTPGLTYTYFYNASGTNQIPNAHAILESGTYYIKGTTRYGCFTIAPIEVIVAKVPQIMVPTAFTPSQPTNNRLYPFMVGVKTFKSFRVFDRWGTLVFEGKDAEAEHGWDGVYRGAIHFLDTVTWYAEGYDYVGNIVRKSGNTVLLK